MIGTLEDFGTGWIGLFFRLDAAEIDSFITLLQRLKAGDIDHFHFYKTNSDAGRGVADVEFSIQGKDEVDNMAVG